MACESGASSTPRAAVSESSGVDDGDTGSIFSEKNPLPTDPDYVYPSSVPKIPKAVAMTGWSRTVGVDEEYVSPAANVRLGAPGTGLSNAAVPTNGAPFGPTLGRKAREQTMQSSSSLRNLDTLSLSSVQVTADDIAAAKLLRKVRPPPDAAPLPSPRPWSETDASSVGESPESVSKPTQNQGTLSSRSTGSSELSFIVGPAGSGSFFGTRPTKGRSVEKLVPATVGETCLHDSLAKYFGHRLAERHKIGERAEITEGSIDGEGGAGAFESDEVPCLEEPVEGSPQQGSTPATKTETRESSFEDIPHDSVNVGPESPEFQERMVQRDAEKQLENEGGEKANHSTGWSTPSGNSYDVDKRGLGSDAQKGRRAKGLRKGSTGGGPQQQDVMCGCLNRRAWLMTVSLVLCHGHIPSGPQCFEGTFWLFGSICRQVSLNNRYTLATRVLGNVSDVAVTIHVIHRPLAIASRFPFECWRSRGWQCSQGDFEPSVLFSHITPHPPCSSSNLTQLFSSPCEHQGSPDRAPDRAPSEVATCTSCFMGTATLFWGCRA